MSALSGFEKCPRCHHDPVGHLNGFWGDYGIELLYAQVHCPYCGLESDHVVVGDKITPYVKQLCVEAWDEAIDSFNKSIEDALISQAYHIEDKLKREIAVERYIMK